MQDIIGQLVQALEYLGVAGLMMVFANELVMPFAGFLAWHGSMTLPGVIIAGAAGSSFGSLLLYSAARIVDHRQIYRLADRYGGWFGVSARSLRRTEQWFDRHARASVFASKFFPGMRSAATLIAGYRRMALWPFLLCSGAGTALSAGLLASLGYFISERYASVSTVAIYASDAFLVLLAAGLVGYGWYRHRRYGRS